MCPLPIFWKNSWWWVFSVELSWAQTGNAGWPIHPNWGLSSSLTRGMMICQATQVLLPIQLGQTGKQKLCNQRRASLPKQETYQIWAQQSSSSAIRICSMRRGLNCHLGTIGDQIILLTDWGYLVTIADQIGDNCWWDQIGDKLGDNWWDCLLQWWRLIHMTLIHWRANSSVQ